MVFKWDHFSRFLKLLPGYLLAAGGLVWVFHDIKAGEIFKEVGHINWWWVMVAVVFDILSYVCQGMRWRFLLKPVGDVPVLKTTQAIYAGLFVNEIVPLRFGELVRAYLVSRWAECRLMSVIPSIAIERLMDGIWICLGIGLTALFVTLPPSLVKAGKILGVVIVLATVLFVALTFLRRKEPAAPPDPVLHHGVLRRIKEIFIHLIHGFREIGLSRNFFGAMAGSFLLLVTQILALWFMVVAYGFGLDFWAGSAILIILHLGTAIPNAPANVGTYQFFMVVGLTLCGIDKTAATGFSVVVFAILTIPLWVLGVFALSRSGLTLAKVRREVNNIMARGNQNRYE